MRFSRSIVYAAAAVALAVASACGEPGGGTATTPPPAPVPVPVDQVRLRTIAADLPILPDSVGGAVRPLEVVKAVYEFAARHQDVLKYVPCVCGCERMGHQGNDMCFVSSRTADGKVREWEPHGAICEVCLDIGRDAMQMYNTGASAEDIRKFIDQKYVAGRSHTPTPMPPHGTGRGGRP
jgi:hypothetical protein